MSGPFVQRAVCVAWTRPVVVAMALVVGLSASVGCGDESGGFGRVDTADVRVYPQVITFNQIPIGETEVQTVTVENSGGSELIVTSWRWSGLADDFIVEGLDGLRVPVDAVRTFTITYAPADEAPDDATLIMETNSGRVEITVTSLGQAAILRTSPSVVELVSDQMGLRVEQQVRIFNIGTEPFEVTGLSLVTGSADFQMTADFQMPAEVGLESEVTLTISYNPSGRGADEGVLLIHNDAANAIDGVSQVEVTGSVRAPFIRFDPDFVAFEAVPLGTTAIETVQVLNEGEATLRITDLYMDFGSSEEMAIESLAGTEYSETGFETVMVAAGESAELVVSYTPTDNEPDNGEVLFVTNDPDFPIAALPMGGRLNAPYLSVTPEVLGFGNVANGLSRTMSVIIRNAGSVPLLVDPPAIEGGGGSFSLVNAGSMPSELAADEAFELLVEFAPQSEGNLDADLVVTSSNDLDHSPRTVYLNGFGAGEPECVLRVVPTTINFGLVPRGSAQVGRAQINNIGSGNCQINRVYMTPAMGLPFPPFSDLFSDAFSLVSSSVVPGTTIGPGESFVIEASYAPVSFTVFSETTLGDTGSISIDAVDPYTGGSVQCGSVALFSFAGFARECGVNLQGMSGVAELAAIPAEVDFGLVTRGCNSQTITVNLYNIGSAPVTVTHVGLEDCTSEFALRGVPPEVSGPGGYELASGSPPMPLDVSYEPAGLGPSTCNLVIESDAETAHHLVVPLTGEGTDTSEQIDHFVQIPGTMVDVLFVIDNSGSMGEEQTNLANNFSSFISTAMTWDNDFQIGIISTQVEEESGEPTPGELIGSPRILTPVTANLNAEFADHAAVGSSGSGARESGLEAAWLALTDPLISDVGPCGSDCAAPYSCVPNARGTESRCGGYNRSFLRDDASLELVFLSDEEDQSRGTIEFYIDFFQSIKGERNRALLHCSAIVGPRGGCSSANGDASQGLRYLDVADATGGVTGSICDANFATSLQNIGNRAFGLRVQFFLSRVAEPATVVVTDADTGTAMTGWTYETESNSIVFSEASAPSPGTEFDVEYTAYCFE